MCPLPAQAVVTSLTKGCFLGGFVDEVDEVIKPLKLAQWFNQLWKQFV